ncbi:MAG TPA: Clp protease N-terminal domain-containing protein [Patescibacteria group bacterium]|nr:Clp protease N-terminal domain-containing protein [Patescibacteria group bacterium]
MPSLPTPRFLEEARTVRALLEGAERHANLAGESLPGAEHLLLSALDLADGTARRAFRRAGADPAALAAAIERQHADALAAVDVVAPDDLPVVPAPRPGGPFRATPAAQSAFRRAYELSATPKPRRLLGAHVVIAIGELGEGTAARSIRALGIEPDRLAVVAREVLDEGTGT